MCFMKFERRQQVCRFYAKGHALIMVKIKKEWATGSAFRYHADCPINIIPRICFSVDPNPRPGGPEEPPGRERKNRFKRRDEAVFLLSFWTLVADNIIEWQEVLNRSLTKRALREDYIVALAITIT